MKKPLRSLILIVLAIAIVGAGAYAFFAKKALSPTDDLREGQASADERYTSAEHGLSFSYPMGYVLTEQEVGSGQEAHHQIMLVRAGDEIAPEGGEGPAAVTIDIYENRRGTGSAKDWMTKTDQSNFRLGPGTYEETDVDGEPAYAYAWSGLYEGRTTVLAHGNDIVAISVTYLSPSDDLLTVYADVLASLRFDNE